jgi:hypothetical protein
MGFGFHDRIYWDFFTITVDYKSSHIALLFDVCLTSVTKLYEKSLTAA